MYTCRGVAALEQNQFTLHQSAQGIAEPHLTLDKIVSRQHGFLDDGVGALDHLAPEAAIEHAAAQRRRQPAPAALDEHRGAAALGDFAPLIQKDDLIDAERIAQAL